ncbi:type II/IV secretion system ATPase subunit [Candidatus Pacearchaeota archaeon]|nr:type II/IV secretion system ATPase subunit [Candidatus Pacearchaeota archaeon]
MIFTLNDPLYKTFIKREEGHEVIYINFLGDYSVPNVSDSGDVMDKILEFLILYPGISGMVLVQQRNYNYGPSETFILKEIANLYVYLTKQENITSPSKISIMNTGYQSQRIGDVTYLLRLLRRDPVACFFELDRFIKNERINIESTPENLKLDQVTYVRILEKFRTLLKNTQMIKELEKYFGDYVFGKREIYYKLFRPDIVPNFAFTRLVATLPSDADIVQQYEIGDEYDKSTVTILKRKEDAKYLYHLMPPEYVLSDEQQLLLNKLKEQYGRVSPESEQFIGDYERARQAFFNVAKGRIPELAEEFSKNGRPISLSYEDVNKLAAISVRATIGFGLMEVLLLDKNIQDIVLNSPISLNPIFLRHQEFDECITNIIPSKEDADSWATRFRINSGRPLDEANPILDTDLSLGTIRARIAVIQQPLSPNGLAYAIRRHREDPWTLPLFIKNRMINSFAAGLFSFMIDGSRTLLIAGTRSSGKTSLLGSLMLEIMPKYRILVVEDTLELPVDALRKLKYDIQRMKVRSSFSETTTERSADEGIRTSLRLGDSSLIVGEVRSTEAKALYEAMRVGALANVVAGTIHGASPYGVFDRVCNDLGVPVTSFKATDCIIVSNPIKTPDGMKSVKRVLQLTEVRKHWTKDPEEENGFINLLKYNIEKDELEPTEELINGDSEIIKSIASGVKGWAGDWDAVYDNILLRAKIKQEVVDVSIRTNLPQLLEAKFNSLSSNMFHQFSKEVQEDIGLPVGEKVFTLWQDWLKEQVRGGRI